jgi:phage tail tape-measure protein
VPKTSVNAGGILGGAAAGASVGSLGGPIGIAVGAIAGGVMGSGIFGGSSSTAASDIGSNQLAAIKDQDITSVILGADNVKVQQDKTNELIFALAAAALMFALYLATK